MSLSQEASLVAPVTNSKSRTSDDLFPHQAELGPLPLPALADSARHLHTSKPMHNFPPPPPYPKTQALVARACSVPGACVCETSEITKPSAPCVLRAEQLTE